MYKITVNGDDDKKKLANFYGLTKQTFEAGETVNFFVTTATDTDYRVVSGQTRIHADDYTPGGRSFYSFVMPEEDVDIEISSYSSMVNNSFMNPYATGQIQFDPDFMNLKLNQADLMSAFQIPPADKNVRKIKMKFCAECGTSTENAGNFCINCGAPINYIEKQDH